MREGSGLFDLASWPIEAPPKLNHLSISLPHRADVGSGKLVGPSSPNHEPQADWAPSLESTTGTLFALAGSAQNSTGSRSVPRVQGLGFRVEGAGSHG